MRIPLGVTAFIALASFSAPYGLQYTAIPKLFSPAALKDPIPPEQLASLTTDLAKIEVEIAEAGEVSSQNGDTLVGALAKARGQQLLLSRVMIENRLRVANGEASIESAVPLLTLDPERASKIRSEIKVVEQEIAAAKEEAALYSGGLVLAMIVSRQETSKLQLAQLRSGLIEAELGVPMTAASLNGGQSAVALPEADAEAQVTQTTEVVAAPPVEPVPTVVERPTWADPNFPEIDYTDQTFAGLAKAGMKMSGWWGVSEVKAPVDDSLSVTAVNVSAVKKGSLSGDVTLIARCQEHETALIFGADAYLMSDFEVYTLPTVYRVDDLPSVSTNWGTLTSNQGVGLFGQEAINFLKQIEGAKKLFVRVTEKNGQNHDALFNLEGISAANGKIKVACGW